MLTKELFSHDYLITRKEAKEVIGLNIIDIPSTLEDTIWQLIKEYESVLQLNVPYSSDTFLATEQSRTGIFHRAIIESTEVTHAFETEKEVRRIQATQPGVPIPVQGLQERTLSEGWKEEQS